MDIVEAKRIWELELQQVMRHAVIDAFTRMWDEAKKSGGREVLKTFQKLCQDVKTWNDTMIRGHTDVVTSACDYFTDLLAAVFVANVKIMSAVKARKKPEKVNVKVPTNDMFIHTVFMNTASNLYSNPYIMQERSEDARERELTDRLSHCVSKSILQLLPKKDVLLANIGTGVHELDDTPQEVEDVHDTEAFEATPEPAKDIDPPEGEADEAPEPPTEVPQEEDEVRQIPAPGEVQESENLFDDAANTQEKYDE